MSWFWRLLGTRSSRSELAFLICRMETGTMIMVLRQWHCRVPMRTRGYSQKTGSQEDQPRWPLSAPNEISRVHFLFLSFTFQVNKSGLTGHWKVSCDNLTRYAEFSLTWRGHLCMHPQLTRDLTVYTGRWSMPPCMVPHPWTMGSSNWTQSLINSTEKETWSWGKGLGALREAGRKQWLIGTNYIALMYATFKEWIKYDLKN